MKNIFKSLLFGCFSLATFHLFAQKKTADLVVYNAVVYTIDNQFAKAEAFAIKSGKFLETGTSKSILANYTAKQKIDAKGKSVFPGLYDPHSHFLGLGQMLSQCDLVDTKSYTEIIERLQKFEAQHKTDMPFV